MGGLPWWITSQMPYFKEQEAAAEEQRKIKEKADRYDRLIVEDGFNDFLKVMITKIDCEIKEATACPMEPEKQRIHITRWNAMREILDEAQNDISFTRAERDRLQTEEREYYANMNEQGEVS